MATYTITINERTKQGKSLRDYLQALGIIKDEKKNPEQTLTLHAIEEAESEECVVCEDFEDYLKKVHV